MQDYHEDLVGDHRKITLHGDYYACTAARDKRKRHQWSVVQVDALDPGFNVIMRCLACGVPALEARYKWYTIHSIAQMLGQGWHIPDSIRAQLGLPLSPTPAPRKPWTPWARKMVGTVAITAICATAVSAVVFVGATIADGVSASLKARCQVTVAAGVVKRVTFLDYEDDVRIVFEDGTCIDADIEKGSEIPSPGTRVRVCKRDHCHVVPAAPAVEAPPVVATKEGQR